MMALERDIIAAGVDAQYDQKAKQLLSHKSILAHILIRTIDEFKGMDPKEVEKHIEGDVKVSGADVNPLIMGRNIESIGENGGSIYYDIIFDVRMMDGISQIIVNIEIQKDEPSGYNILNRAVYYSGCMLSAQKGRDFAKSNYNGIKPVYSIWICLNMRGCYWNHIHLTNDFIMGDYKWKGRLDLIHIIMLGIPDKVSEEGSGYELHRLLGTLLSDNMEVSDRIEIISNEYGIEMEQEIREEMTEMCNLSQGILERGVRQGREEGLTEGRAEGRAEGIELGLSKGRTQTLYELVQDGAISVEAVADRMKVSPAEVEADMEKRGYKIPTSV